MKTLTLLCIHILGFSALGLLQWLIHRRKHKSGLDQPARKAAAPHSPAQQKAREPSPVPYDRAFLDKMSALVEEHLSEEDFNVSALAEMMGMSRSGLFSKIKALTGQSPQEYLTECRLSRAWDLLQDHDFNISEIAYKVGFSTLNGLSRAFKNKYGVPPSAI